MQRDLSLVMEGIPRVGIENRKYYLDEMVMKPFNWLFERKLFNRGLNVIDEFVCLRKQNRRVFEKKLLLNIRGTADGEEVKETVKT